MPPLELWTIGHSTRSISDFIALLGENGVETIADVRRIPGSRRYPHFGQQALAAHLAEAGLGYAHILELGGRRRPRPDSPNTGWRHEAFRGYADHMSTKAFGDGIATLLRLAETKRVAVMCAEALWWQCHRRLIADYLTASDRRVVHIMGTGKADVHRLTAPAHLVEGKLSYAGDPDLLGPETQRAG
jgi:uncharacterized protein (DUF488 family)